MNFGENLKIFRKNAKISQEELASKIGVTRQSVSKWEVGDAYPEMSNIVALCSIFHCNINDLINDTIVDIDSFSADTKEEIIKFKVEQQKRMKFVSKTIYIIANIVKIVIAIPSMCILLMCLIFPFISNKFEINDDYIKIFEHKIDYEIDGNLIIMDGEIHYVETSSNLKEFISNHNNSFFRRSIEYVMICVFIFSFLTVIFLYYLSLLYKNIYNGNTPFTLENEKIVYRICIFLIIQLLFSKVTAVIYSLIANIDLAIDINIKDIIYLLIAISVVYIFKYGRLIQADSKAKIYD